MAKLTIDEQRILLILEKYKYKYIDIITIRRNLKSTYGKNVNVVPFLNMLNELEQWAYIKVIREESGKVTCTITEVGIKALPLEA